MKLRIAILLLLPLLISRSYGQTPSSKTAAKKIVERSIQVMGGDAWKSVHSLSFEGYGYENSIDQSERPEGPYIPSRYTQTILKDIANKRFQVDQKGENYDFAYGGTYLFNEQATAQKAGGKVQPTLQAQQLYDDLYLSPELVLQTALASPDLTFVKDTTYQKAKHWILSFRFEGFPVRIFLNRETNLLTAVEITRPYKNAYFGIWGDIKKTNVYSFWMLLGKGLHYPIQQDTYVNGYYDGCFLINKWKVNPELNTDSLTISADVKQQDKLLYDKQSAALQKQIEQGGKEIAPGVWLVRGPCNSTIISQPDGIVVIESSHASFYGDALIKKAHALFPGKKIKALITTSDAWLHIGGVRAFAALSGVKIYHPVRNRFILDKLLRSSYKTEPDAFAKISKPSYTLISVTDTMVIGSGANKLVLYAYRTETGDRQMMVYFPQHKMLYTSDHYQPKGPDGTFWNPEIVSEVYHSILQRKLDVKQFYAMHSKGVMPFSEMEDDVTKME